MINWFFSLLYPPVWIQPFLNTEDDGFELWKFSPIGELLDKRFMSEQKRFREYGEVFECQSGE